MVGSFKDSLLSKSGQFRYYKSNYERLVRENQELKEKLNHQVILEEAEKNNVIQELLSPSRSFSNWKYIEYYFRDDFDKIFSDSLKNLSPENKKRFKLVFIRTLMGAYTYRDSLFSQEELDLNDEINEFKESHVSKDKILDFNIIPEDYNITCFMESAFKYEDKLFLKDKDIIDAGAFIGDSALPLSKLTSKNVYAFEPFDESYNKMLKNIELNNINNIIPVNSSLADFNGNLTLYLSGNNIQGITSDVSIRDYDKELNVESKTLDSFVEENNLNVGLIKIDIEGGEQDLLKGAINTIKTQKPIIFVSIYHKADDFFKIKPWIESLDLDYEFEIVKEKPLSFIADTVLECRPKNMNSIMNNLDSSLDNYNNNNNHSSNLNTQKDSINKLISVIMPIYNSEDYLKKSISSVINQSIGFENIELICINDCSTDKSPQIIDDYSNKYDNIKVIHLDENSKYAGKPRNIGLKNVTTDYVMFLDSDDYYNTNACEVLYNKIANSDYYIVFGEHINVFANGKESIVNHLAETNLILDKNSKELFDLNPAIQTKIYKKVLIEDIEFPENIPGEDLVFNLKSLCVANKVLYLNNIIFNRIIRVNDSVSFILAEDYLLGLLKSYELSLDTLLKYNIRNEFINLLLVNHLSFFIKQLVKSNLNLEDLINSQNYIDFKNHSYFNNNFEFNQLFINLENGIYDNSALLDLIKNLILIKYESKNNEIKGE